ncbi:MAG TPA: IS1595 family transposase [Pyrinomonadaceae bacterium]|nr:IS1595 family transposase [Pyrinomonadaceae bacterium]
MKNEAFPKTLIQAVRYFSDPDTALGCMVAIRWPDGIECPRCESREYSFVKTRRIWICKGCKKHFSVKIGTIMEDSPIDLDKWLTAIWLIVNAKNGISSYEIHRSVGVTQKSAWFLLHRIRKAMQTGTFKKFSGEVEVDETFIGGLARNMHESKRRHMGTGGAGKVAVMGLLERHGEVRAHVVADLTMGSLQPHVERYVEHGATVHTDKWVSYNGLESRYIHNVINHAERYVEGNVHTNGIENSWSLLKRTLKGTYVSVEPFHLFRYLDEQSFRFNNRKADDSDRFIKAASQITGKRVTYKQLTGKEPAGYETSH